MVVFTFCCRLLVVCLTRGEASASERRSVPKQQTGSGGYRFVGSSGLSPRKICIGYRTGLYLSRKSQVHAGLFRGPYSFSPAPYCVPAPLCLPSILPLPLLRTISLPYKGLPLPLGNFPCSHGVFPLQCLFGPFSKSLSVHQPPSHRFSLAPHVHPLSLHSSRMTACLAASDIPRVSFNPVHIAVCIVFLRTTHLCPLVPFTFSFSVASPLSSPARPSLLPAHRGQTGISIELRRTLRSFRDRSVRTPCRGSSCVRVRRRAKPNDGGY